MHTTRMLLHLILAFGALIGLVGAAPGSRAVAVSQYPPIPAKCPSTPLIRPASGTPAAENQYIVQRYPKASANLKTWLKKQGFNLIPKKYPLIGLTTSGGGYRSLLVGAGVIQGFDGRDSTSAVAGLYQALTYQAGLSGGSWLLSSLAGNDYPTISSLRDGLWGDAFQRGLLLPVNLQAPDSYDAYVEITADVLSKQLAGFNPTLTDPWGRFLSYTLLRGPDGGAANTMAGITTASNIINKNVPFPIITALGVKSTEGQCVPSPNAVQYEFTPYEFGSWDKGVSAFMQTAYLGSSIDNGRPSLKGCVQKYDNLGYVLGTSSNLFSVACGVIPPSNTTTPTFQGLSSNLEAVIAQGRAATFRDLFAIYPNPFYKYTQSSLVQSQKELYLVDGGLANQNNPIWPFLHRSNVDVLIVNDNSADTSENYPNGTEIRTTYEQAQAAGLTRMPFIPTVEEFVSKGLDKSPAFFGCNDKTKLTIVWLPNTNYTYPSGQSTFKLQYSKAETTGMIANGAKVASKNDDANWPLCLACGLMKKSLNTSAIAACATCFQKYCYN